MLGHVAVGTWSGGRFMRFGEPISDERLEALLRPGGGISTRHHRRRLRRRRGRHPARPRPGRRAALASTRSPAPSATTSTRASARAPRASRASPTRACAAPTATATTCAWPWSGASSAAASTPSTSCSSTTPTGAASSRLRSGRRSASCATRASRGALGVAPGPANGFTLDVIGCFERYGELIDWAMLILNPFEPWPGELALDAAVRHNVKVLTRVVDYGGLFHDDVLPGHRFDSHDHRGFRPRAGSRRGASGSSGSARSPTATGSRRSSSRACGTSPTMPSSASRPTLIQEPGADAKPIERKREELAAVPARAGAERRGGRRDPRGRATTAARCS